MKDSIDGIRESVIYGLSDLIRYYLLKAANQQYNPSSDPDRMDCEIADGKDRATKLRKMREEFEDIITGII